MCLNVPQCSPKHEFCRASQPCPCMPSGCDDDVFRLEEEDVDEDDEDDDDAEEEP